jgi:diguanylate cyclase (GGDEF)-like protein
MPRHSAAEPTPPSNQLPPGTSVALHTFRLRVLKLLLTFSTLAIIMIWPVEVYTHRLAWLDGVAYPLMLLVFLSSLIMVYIRPRLLTIAERASFWVFAIYATAQLQGIIIDIQSPKAIYSLATILQWFPLVYTAAFIFFNTRQAVTISGLIYASMLIPIIVKLVGNIDALITNDSYPLLLNLLSSHPAYVITLSGITMLKDHLVQVGADARLMRDAANIDYLTGVANRRASVEELQAALAAQQRSGEVLSVLLIDIDHFKQVNDRFGHDVGDKVLIDLAVALREQLDAACALGRWGGEEFIIIARGLGRAEAAQLAERLRLFIMQRPTPQSAPITLSLGVAAARPQDTPESLVKRADDALYEAKRRGRNQVVSES